MGPSGSGKTTLLDLLAGRKNTGKTEGTLLFAGQKPTQQFLRRYTGYVEQFGEREGLRAQTCSELSMDGAMSACDGVTNSWLGTG
jgi:Fe-S cluster assembly ATPase SufC